MFKDNTYRDKISKVWGNMWEASPTRDPPQAQRIASFTCLTPASPSYQYCKRRTNTLSPTNLEPVVGLCPAIFNLPPNGGDYNPWQCPVLFGNIFAVRPTGNLFVQTLAEEIWMGFFGTTSRSVDISRSVIPISRL